MHNPWQRGAGNILSELFTSIVLKMTIKDHFDWEEEQKLCLELNRSKLASNHLRVMVEKLRLHLVCLKLFENCVWGNHCVNMQCFFCHQITTVPTTSTKLLARSYIQVMFTNTAKSSITRKEEKNWINDKAGQWINRNLPRVLLFSRVAFLFRIKEL